MFDEGTTLREKVLTFVVAGAFDALFIIGSWLLWAVMG